MRRRGSRLLFGVAAALLAACGDSTSPGIEGAPASVVPAPDSATPGSVTPGSVTPGSVTPEPGRRPEGFTTIQARITDADGEVCEVCLWLADDSAERARGLMGVTDLGAAAGMAFRFDEPRSGWFYMFQTPTPLSIAWFAPDGSYVGAADMAPCLESSAGDCPLYSPGVDYDLAIEVFQGGLEVLGVGPGSSVEVIEGSEAASCSATA